MRNDGTEVGMMREENRRLRARVDDLTGTVYRLYSLLEACEYDDRAPSKREMEAALREEIPVEACR